MERTHVAVVQYTFLLCAWAERSPFLGTVMRHMGILDKRTKEVGVKID